MLTTAPCAVQEVLGGSAPGPFYRLQAESRPQGCGWRRPWWGARSEGLLAPTGLREGAQAPRPCRLPTAAPGPLHAPHLAHALHLDEQTLLLPEG